MKPWILISLGEEVEKAPSLFNPLPPPSPKAKAALGMVLFQTGLLHRISFEPSVWQFMQSINEGDCISTRSHLKVEGTLVWQHKSRPNHKSRQCNASRTDRLLKCWQVLDN